jgi:hypothetical protein
MAINRNLLLPSASSSSAIVKKTFNASALASIKTNKKELTLSPQKTSLKDLLSSINETVKKINIIVKKTTLSQSKAYKDGLKEARLARNAERERKLEEKKKDKPKEKEEKKIPGLGFLDRIKRFLFFTFLGWLTNKYWDKLPQVLEFTKKLTPIIDVIETIGGALFNGVVNFIDTGYKVYDGLRDFTKQIGGEDFQKKFDDFSKNLNTFINIAIIAGMATMGGTDFGSRGGRRGGPGGGKPGRGGYRNGVRTGQYNGFNTRTTRSGNLLSRTGDALRAQRGDWSTSGYIKSEKDIMKRYFQKHGRDAAIRRFGQEGVESLGGKYARSGVTNLARKGAVSLLGKGGTKAALRIVQPLVRNIPLIGGIMEFVLSWMSGDSPGKAAFKGVGAGLGTWVGGAIGSLIPIPGVGTAIGMWLGSQGGSALGEALYNKIFENREPGQKKLDQPKKKARGGVTRGGKKVAENIGRSLKIQRTIKRNLISPKPNKIIPGVDVGGENKIKSMFPEPSMQQSGLYQNPFGFLYNSTNSMGDVPYIGPLFSLFGKLLLGQSPKSSDYKIISLGLTAWINNAITDNLLNGNNIEKMIKEMPIWMESSIKKLVDGVTIDVLNQLKEYLLLKPLREMFSSSQLSGSEAGELGSASDAVGGARLFMAAGFPMLAAAILSGNVQQESGWKGQRTPWVLNDGAGTNKGLISWNRTRITNAEKFLGKPLETASNAEQVKWIKEELRQYGLLDDFMNPQATEAQLQEASYKYIGWGHLGKRWDYSKQIFSALQKGEQGTYSPGVNIRLGSNNDAALGSKLAGELGDFMKQWGGVPGDVHRHPKHLPWDPNRGHSPGSLHYQAQGARAIDLGSWANEQGPILKKIEEFNRLKGVSPVQLLHAGNDPTGNHDNHVHVAYKDGGMIGPNKPRNIKPLQESASYDEGYMILIQPVIIEKPVPAMDNKINFSGGGSVNINKDKSSLFIR